MQNWVVVMRQTNDIEYQIFEGAYAEPKKQLQWRRKLRGHAGSILANLIWWWLTN